MFGTAVLHVRGPVGLSFLGLGVAVILVALWYVRRHEAALEEEAERALPGPLERAHLPRIKRNK
jgi:uncharacterized membrane protein